MISTALLVPLSAFADPQLSTSMSVSSCWESSDITTGDCQNYNHNQTAPPGTSLSDSGANAEAPWAQAAARCRSSMARATWTVQALPLAQRVHRYSEAGAIASAASWNSQMTINSPGLDGQQATVRITFHGSGDASGSASSYLASSSMNYSYFVSDYQNSISYGGAWDPTNGWTGDGSPARTFTFDATCTIGQPCEILHQVHSRSALELESPISVMQ